MDFPLEKTVYQERKPLVDLKKDAKEFQVKFVNDIRECLIFVDGQITALISKNESDFSRSKYETFSAIKSIINAKEKAWLNYIAHMMEKFGENVEKFLALTKSEVTLLPPEAISANGKC